ncbi:unnamed protein product [Effrenium voratum]|nr:unnamed protein product [Effrenium voratum]
MLPAAGRGRTLAQRGPKARYKQVIGDVALRASRLKNEEEVQHGAHKLRPGDAQFWAGICSELHHYLKQLSSRNISLVLSSLARKQVKDAQLLDYVAGQLSPAWLTVFNIQDLALLCNSYASLGHPAPDLFRICAEELLWKLPDASAQELALIASAFAKLRAYDAALFRHIAALAMRQAEDIGPRHAANLLHAFARTSAPEPPAFFERMASTLAGGAGVFCSLAFAV